MWHGFPHWGGGDTSNVVRRNFSSWLPGSCRALGHYQYTSDIGALPLAQNTMQYANRPLSACCRRWKRSNHLWRRVSGQENLGRLSSICRGCNYTATCTSERRKNTHLLFHYESGNVWWLPSSVCALWRRRAETFSPAWSWQRPPARCPQHRHLEAWNYSCGSMYRASQLNTQYFPVICFDLWKLLCRQSFNWIRIQNVLYRYSAWHWLMYFSGNPQLDHK